MLRNKKLKTIVPELFISGRKLIISVVFVTQLLDLNFRHYFIMKISYKHEL